ncbi:MAG: hypothetical protein HQ518_02725, partial [Rhodopirellula sp.]|nr:hypothetical protein [Rhodopirellula sp.]
FLASSKDATHELIVGYLDRPAVPVPASYIRFLVHTGGADRESRVLWKSIDIHADDIPQPKAVAPQVGGRGLLDSVIDVFRSPSNPRSEASGSATPPPDKQANGKD